MRDPRAAPFAAGALVAVALCALASTLAPHRTAPASSSDAVAADGVAHAARRAQAGPLQVLFGRDGTAPEKKVSPPRAGASPSADHGACEFPDGTRYDCASTFDAVFYRAANTDLRRMSLAGVEAHWHAFGIREGRAGHAGRRTLKPILMVKDEWPLLRSWVLYHAALLGGRNLYVVDASTDAESRRFLQAAQRALGVNAFRSDADLNSINGVIVDLAKNLSRSGDFIGKFDTDEFLVLADGVPAEGAPVDASAPGATMTADAGAFHAFLSSLPNDGRRLELHSWAWALPERGCRISDDPARATRFFTPRQEIHRKTLVSAWAYEYTDLGGHGGAVRAGFNQTAVSRVPRLAIAHFHNQCYARKTLNDKKACASHGYAGYGDDPTTELAKLAALEDKIPPRACGINSCHKVRDRLDHLRNPAAHEDAYYRPVDGPGNTTAGGGAHALVFYDGVGIVRALAELREFDGIVRAVDAEAARLAALGFTL